MSTTPPIQYSGPVISPSVEWETRRHLQLIYQKLGNHTQAFSLQQQQIATLTPGSSTTTVVEGGSGGGGGGTTTATGTPVNNQSGQTSYSTVSGDNNALIVFSDAAAIAVTLNSQSPPWSCFIANIGALGAGTVTLTPFTGTISYAGNPGATSMPLLPTYCALAAFDGTNWWGWTEPIVPVDFSAISHQFLTAYDAVTGVLSAAQPAFTDISGIAAPSQIPTPTASTIGGVESIGPVSHEWINEIDTSGVPHLTQPAFTDISGIASVAQGGTGTSTPSLVEGSNVTITGTWPNQTIAASGGGGGGVTSVALTVPSRQTVTGSPITTSGTLAITDNTESANQIFAGPTSGSAAAPAFRGLVPADVPVITIGFVIASCTVASNIGPMLAAPRAGTVSKCVIVTKTSDPSTALTIQILQNGTDVFATNPTVAAGTSSGTVSTFTSLTSSPLTVSAGDVFSLNCTGGTSAWVFSAQLET